MSATAGVEKGQYDDRFSMERDRDMQDFVKFVNEKEELLNRVPTPDPKYFSESPEAALEYAKSQQKGRQEELPPTERAIQELKRFQQEAKEAKPEQLLAMIDTIALCIEAIESTIYKEELEDKENRPGLRVRIQELKSALLKLQKDPSLLENIRQQVRDLSAEVNKVYVKAKNEGVVIDFEEVPDVNQMKVSELQEQVKNASVKNIKTIGESMLAYARLAQLQMPGRFKEEKLDERMDGIINDLATVTGQNLEKVKNNLNELAQSLKPIYANLRQEIKVRPGTPQNVYELCNIIMEGEDEKYKSGGEYELISAETGKFQYHNFYQWFRDKMEETRQNNPDSEMNFYTDISIVRDVQGGVRKINFFDIFYLEHTLMLDRVPEKVIGKNGEETTVYKNKLTPEMENFLNFLGNELFLLHTSHNSDVKYRKTMAEAGGLIKALQDIYYWSVFTNKNRMIDLFHTPSATKEEIDKILKGEKIEGTFGREVQRYLRAYFYLPQIAALTETQAEPVFEKARRKLEEKNNARIAKGEKAWTKEEMELMAQAKVPYIIKDLVEEKVVVEDGKKKIKKYRIVGTAKNKFEDALGEKGTRAFFERVSKFILQEKLGGVLKLDERIKQEKEKGIKDPQKEGIINQLLQDPESFIQILGEANKGKNGYNLTPEDIAFSQTNPKKFTEILLGKVMNIPESTERRGGLAALNLWNTPKINYTLQKAVSAGMVAAALAEDSDLVAAGRMRKKDAEMAERFATSMNYWLLTPAYGDTEGTGFDFAGRWTHSHDYRIKLRSGVGELDTIPGFRQCAAPSLLSMNIRDKNQRQMSIMKALDNAWEKDPKKRTPLFDYSFDIQTMRQHAVDHFTNGQILFEYLCYKNGMQFDKLLGYQPYTGQLIYSQTDILNAIRRGPEKWLRYLVDTSGIRKDEEMTGGGIKSPRLTEAGTISYVTEFRTDKLRKLMFNEEVNNMKMYEREPLKTNYGGDFHRNVFAYLIGKELWEFSYKNKKSHKEYFTSEHLEMVKMLFEQIPLEVNEVTNKDGKRVLEVKSSWFNDEEWEQVEELAMMNWDDLIKREFLIDLGKGLTAGIWQFFLKFLSLVVIAK